MKIVHMTSAHGRYDQRILWRECCSLCEHGYDVTLVVNDSQENETLENGVRILSTGFVPQNRWQRMTEGVRCVYELGVAQSADIYHLHDPELLRIALKLKRQGKKVIFDSHEIYGEQIRTKSYIPSIGRGIIAELYTSYETYVCRRIDGVIDTSPYNNRDTFLNRSKQFCYVPNYPKRSEYCEIDIPVYRKRKGVCYSGGLTESRGIRNVVQAAKLAGVPVVLAGKFDSQKFQDEILRTVGENTISYLGYLKSRKDIFKMYSQCAIGASLLHKTGQYLKDQTLPTKVFEYMAASMPVIISDVPYNRNLIKQYRFGVLADPMNVDDIAIKITWLQDHPDEAERMGRIGRKLVEREFSWSKSEKELIKMYNKIEE